MNQHVTTGAEYLRKILLSPVYDVARVTPLDYLEKLSERIGNQVFLKREDLQPVHSFKLRGAYNKIARLPADARERGIVAASAGNHAQGCALSGSRLGVKATIVMPRTTPDIKVDAVRRFGGNVVLFGNSFDEAYAESMRLAREEGLTLIPPYDDPDVIAGQGTAARELLEQNSRLSHVFVQVGGGGLAAGVAVYIKQILPEVKVIAVEAEGSACLKAAWEKGEPVSLDRVSLFADGVAVKRIGDETFRVLRKCVDEVITCSNDEICAALKDIFDDTRAIAEPSGALSLAGLKKYAAGHGLRGENMAAILSGANMNFHTLRFVSERCEVGERREGIISVTIPEKKGAFLDLCKKLGQRMVTEFNYRFCDPNEAEIFTSLRLTGGLGELEQIIAGLRADGYHVTDMTRNTFAKNHVRYMIGGKAPAVLKNERILSFQFPERTGALLQFLETLGSSYNITMFHYRNHGAEYGRVACGFDVAPERYAGLAAHLDKIGFAWWDETENAASLKFLSPLAPRP
ncbi:threonine ammonia-lyase, biosynthetic [uncultured Mailhella sp.]|uniref:threonine ammonia-lyase, biosynthetic n=1 Tax=uncultured Mailhella sp. TaxID=1981031 RepID=UPI00260CA215|nr:threonine ammonia-lyase, biosynthetic [uncultured Mailhella sp.]